MNDVDLPFSVFSDRRGAKIGEGGGGLYADNQVTCIYTNSISLINSILDGE